MRNIQLKFFGDIKPEVAMQGNAYFDKTINQMLVYNGVDWISTLTRKPVDTEDIDKIHEQHPYLKQLWEEYQILKKLKVGGKTTKC